MPTKTLTIVASVIAVMLVVTLPRPAAAQPIDEPLMYPGSNCIKVTGGTPTFFASVSSSSLSPLHGTLQNNTTSTMVVQCPMYDNGFNFTGRIWVIDNNVTQNITCCSKTRNPLGGAEANQCKSTSGNSSSPKTLDFDGPDKPGTFTRRFYDCSLPPTTSIIQYRGIAQ
jgi:hypothetical protein